MSFFDYRHLEGKSGGGSLFLRKGAKGRVDWWGNYRFVFFWKGR